MENQLNIKELRCKKLVEYVIHQLQQHSNYIEGYSKILLSEEMGIKDKETIEYIKSIVVGSNRLKELNNELELWRKNQTQ